MAHIQTFFRDIRPSEELSEIGLIMETSKSREISRPSSNWLTLRKSLGHPRKRRKVDGAVSEATSFSRRVPDKQNDTGVSGKEVDLETTEIKNGESVAALRKMVLGKVEYDTFQTIPGTYLALDCEMVGVGFEGRESSLARVSIVNYTGAVILDVFVKQREKVVDYRTEWSGVRSTDLAGLAKPFREVQQIVADLIKDRILVGHAIYNDLKALLLSHPSPQIRDTQLLTFKHRVVKSRRPALRVLVKQELGIVIQSGEHSSVTDARATMALFRLHKKRWESSLRPRRILPKKRPKSKSSTLTRLSPSSSPRARHLKRKRSGSPEPNVVDTDGADRALQPSSPAPIPFPSSSLAHISVSTPRSKQGDKSQPPADLMKRKGVSSKTTTATWKAARKWMSGAYGSKGAKKTSKAVEEWWKSLEGGKQASVKL